MNRWDVWIEKDEDGYFVAHCPALPGCHSQGHTEEEALDNIKEAIALCLEARLERARRQYQGMPREVSV